jgi:hypothetical protein
MNGQKWSVLAVVLALVAGAVLVLQRAGSLHTLGRPGLKMIPQPVYDEKTNVINTSTVALPEAVLDYRSKVIPITCIEVEYLPRDTTFARRLYEPGNGPPLMLNVVLMGTDRGSIHQPQFCLTGQGWKIEQSELTTVPIPRPQRYELPVMKLTASKRIRTKEGGEVDVRSLYVYWFVADGELSARHGQRMWWMARDLLLTGTLQRWAYVSCWSQCRPGQEEATFEAMKRFLGAAVPEFQLVSLNSPPPAPALPGS